MSTKPTFTHDLGFISNKELRQTIEDSIQYISVLFTQAESSNSNLYREESYRVIILYVIAIVESILHYTLNQRNEKIYFDDYKYVHTLNANFKHARTDGQVVVAVKISSEKDKQQIGFSEIVKYFKNKKLMRESVADTLLNLNTVRNTFHFTKPRNEITCEVETVEEALDALVSIIQRAPKVLKLKK